MSTLPRAPWRDQLDETDRRHLERRDHSDDRSPDVLVVGGGIVGVCTAVACQRAGLGGVTLIERDRLGAGSTGGAAGLLQPDPHHGTDPEPFVEFGRQSLELWRTYDATVDGGVGLIDVDWFGLDPQPPGFVTDLPITALRIDAGHVSRLLPELARPVGGVRIPHQGRVNPLRAIARLAALVPTVITGVEAGAVTIRGQQVVSVTTNIGEFSPGAVVFATGGPPLQDGLPLDVPSQPVKGHLLATEPAPFRLPGLIAPLATQLDDDRLLSGGTLDVGDNSPAVRAEVVSAMKSTLNVGIPAASALGITHAWCCFRPAHPDGLPIIDRAPTTTNAWFSSGHFRTGILMAPATGRALATWIADGEAPRGLAFLASNRASLRPLA
ncbi:MAG TPA: FAD-binding oxidoreductase [Acidimicrobiia bacterium]|nr:FAD-binding oxidoreductase [Acidimicrobiia bacterium]